MDSATLAKKIADYNANPITSASATNEALAQFGVPEIRQSVANMRTTLANTQNSYNSVDPSVTGRTQGSLVTEAQRQHQVVNERAPIAQQLDTQGKSLSQGDSDLKDALDRATMTATNRVNDYNSGRAALQSQYDTAYTREQNAAQAEAARQAADRAQSNSNREFALASSKAGGSQAPTKADVGSHIVQSLNSLRGKDGHVSNETWQNALNDWTTVGGTIRDFWKNYEPYLNPKYKSSYAGYNNR